MQLSQRDQKIIWHPFTQEKTAPEVIAVQRASGSYLYDENNKAYLDLISSWWVNLHGHAHPDIARSIYEQAMQLEHVIFAGFTHEPAVRLCEGLQSILPKALSRFFFSDNGSTAVEVALKMAYQYWQNRGFFEKKIFLSFEGGYHGDTFGAMSVGAQSGFHDAFRDLFFKVLSLPYPHTWDEDESVEEKEMAALSILDDYLEQHANHIAAIILEPLMQGASGMRQCRADFLMKVLQRLKERDILIIFDEIMTGFGRTGTYFAMDQLGIVPDFICVSKGITGGFLPLALTVTNEKIYEAFLSEDFKQAFAHGHSYTANPLACRAAITSLALLQSPSCQASIKAIHEAHQQGINFLKKNVNIIEKTRILGTISAFDIRGSVNKLHLKEQFLREGLMIRPLGNTIYCLPPYSITSEELKGAYEKIEMILTHISHHC